MGWSTVNAKDIEVLESILDTIRMAQRDPLNSPNLRQALEEEWNYLDQLIPRLREGV